LWFESSRDLWFKDYFRGAVDGCSWFVVLRVAFLGAALVCTRVWV